jgi:hypothetical protein
MKGKLFRGLLYIWIIGWGALFIVSAYNNVADPLALIMCLLGMILWGRIADKGWRP